MCPARTYGDSVGLAECTSCPYPELSRGDDTEGLTSIDQCGSFQTSGFWWNEGSGSLAGGNAWSSTLSLGVEPEDPVELSDALRLEVRSAMLMGTSFETRSEEGWAVETASSFDRFSAAVEYFNRNSVGTSRNFSSFEVSEAVTVSLSTTVATSLINYTEMGCPLTCQPFPPLTVAYGWRWIHSVYDVTHEKIALLVDTCEIYCLYNPDESPQCPPGRCANTNCTVCFSGSFVDSEVDRISSNSTNPDSSAPNTSIAPTNEKGGGGISTGAVVGIAFGSIVAVIAIGAATRRWFVGRSKHGDPIEEEVGLQIEEEEGFNSPPLVAMLVEPVPVAEGPIVAADVWEAGSRTYSAVAVSDSGPDYKDQVRTNMGDRTHNTNTATAAEVSGGGPVDSEDQSLDAKPAAKVEL